MWRNKTQICMFALVSFDGVCVHVCVCVCMCVCVRGPHTDRVELVNHVCVGVHQQRSCRGRRCALRGLVHSAASPLTQKEKLRVKKKKIYKEL